MWAKFARTEEGVVVAKKAITKIENFGDGKNSVHIMRVKREQHAKSECCRGDRKKSWLLDKRRLVVNFTTVCAFLL